ncbi:PhzF family phenazine biosynthesis protein [Sodalis sp. dw_96]|uniref:PhzF family phenazine biosynthesis protein n=1 Tax=Sodalis sp. dw_96 TaxID=2719794 RepID=UPI001BD6B773|nr:PhzF family phenazine biosynthesis protein [Sodalis sp. dw_96]
MQKPRKFKQVDVFTAKPLKGNPLAVILDGEGLSDAEMAAIARWTNLSETTFVLKPGHAAADYRVRIFTTDKELPFAGHPTLGTAHALLEAGLKPKQPGYLVQECGIGLVRVKLHANDGLSFAAPSVTLKPISDEHQGLLALALPGGTIHPGDAPTIADMGVVWLMVRMADAQSCLDIVADFAAIELLQTLCNVNGVAVYGLHEPNGPADYEVRAFMVEHHTLVEDPVTGSANACLAQILKSNEFPDGGHTAKEYRVRQGTALQRDGRVKVTFENDDPWIGGQVCTLIDGTLRI